MIRDFNSNWLFQNKNGIGRTVHLPHDAMMEEERTAMCHNGTKTGYYPGGKYIYTKALSLTEEEAAGYVALRFGGIYRNATIIVNDTEVMRHRYGYTPFTVELSGVVKAGENAVVVKVDNSLEPNSRWYSGSGIYRSVTLTLAKAKPPADVMIRTKSIHPAIITVETEQQNVSVRILDGKKTVAEGTSGDLEIPDAKFWSAETPNLYTCLLTDGTNETRISFGIRMLEVSAKGGLRINGQEIKLRGGCVHHDNGVIGARSFRDAEFRKVRILKECGYNAIRCAHNPCSDELLEACDVLGMYMLDEAYDGWYTPKNHHDSARDFAEEYEQVLTEMVTRDRNHPSVILYSIGNEMTEVGEERGVRTAAAMQELVHGLDPTRPVTCGINTMLTVWAKMGLAVYKDKEPYQPVPLPQEQIKQPRSGSALYNAISAKLGKFMDVQVNGRKADKALSGISEVLDIMGLNYGSRRYEKELKEHPERPILGTENRIDALPEIWEKVLRYPAIFGDFCWTAMDHIGEAGIGYWRYPSEPGLPLLSGCGAVDLIGIPDVMNGFQRVIWELEKNPVISVRPLNHAEEKPLKTAWRFTDGLSAWTWTGYEGKTAHVEVFSQGEYAELFLNGAAIGKRRLQRYTAAFTCRYEPGTLEAVAYSKDGAVLGRTLLRTGGIPTLKLTSDRNVLRANGQDLTYVMIELSDDDGIVTPIDDEQIELEVSGPITLLGLGSAAGISDENYTDHIHKTYRGRCLAVIRSGYDIGEGRITVKSKSYGEAIVHLDVQQEV